MGLKQRTMVLSVVTVLGCGSSAKQGAAGESCYPNGTCDDGLVCAEETCQQYPEFDAGLAFDAAFDANTLLADAGIPGLGADMVHQVLGVSTRDLDLLFLIDNSGTMAQEQSSLAQRFDILTIALASMEGGLPNLHVGVITTSLGAGEGITGCAVPGEAGVLQNQPQVPGCSVPADRYLSDLSDIGGGRIQNFAGTLDDSFACIAQVGTTGCGFEQHFGAIERALNGSNAVNEGFLRDDAMLAIVIVSDEDDCTASDPFLYDITSEQDNLSSTLGPLSGYRCFEFGVTCAETTDDPPADRVNYGARTDCVPRVASPYMDNVSHIVGFLNGLKAAPGLVMLNVIGGVGDVVIDEVDGGPHVAASCSTSTGIAYPGIRLEAASALLGMGTTKSICADDLGPALTGIGAEMIARMSGTCLVEEATPSCVFNDVSGYGTETEAVVQALPLCSAAAQGACVTLIDNSQDCVNGKTEVVIDRRGTTPALDTVVVASCPR